MNIKNINKYFFLFLFFCFYKVYSINEILKFQKVIEKITILGENSGYIKSIQYKGRFTKQSDKIIPIFSNELEKVGNFKRLDYYSGQELEKGIKVNIQAIQTNSFYDNIKGYFVQLEDTSLNFSIQYEVSSKHLILLSSFDLISYPNSDTIVYEINCPRDLFLILKPDTNIHFYHIDTLLIDNNVKKYSIISIPNVKQNLKTKLVSNYEFEQQVVKPIRSIVISSGKLDSWKYFNNWFNELIKDNIKLKSQSISFFNSIITNKETEAEITRKVFDYVKSNIKYVDIENGIEGFRPRDVNDILVKKYGDCKDMANLICQILKYYNINASIAIIATVDYSYKTDFPSLSSANHAICVVKTKSNEFYYLDATNKTGRYDMPSEFIQGQDFFAVNNDGGYLGKVPVISADKNSSEMIFNLSLNNNILEGTVTDKRLNYSSSFIKYLVENHTVTEGKVKINQYYAQLSPNIKFLNIKTEIEDDSSITNSEIIMSNSINNIEGKCFLLLKGLIFPHQYPKKINKGYRFIPFKTFDNHFVYQINFGHKIKIISKPQDVKIETESGIMSFNIIAKDEKTVIIDCRFIMNKIELSDSDIKDYERINDELQKKINSSIEYEFVD